jgi:hypothetical protein
MGQANNLRIIPDNIIGDRSKQPTAAPSLSPLCKLFTTFPVLRYSATLLSAPTEPGPILYLLPTHTFLCGRDVVHLRK